MSGRIFIGIGAILFLVAVYQVYLGASPIPLKTMDMYTLGAGFDGDIPIEPSKVNGYIAQTDVHVRVANQKGLQFANWSTWLKFTALIVSSIITIVSGIQTLRGDKKGLTGVIGVLGIIASVTLGVNTYTEDQSKAKFTCVDKINDGVRQTLSEVREETDAALAERYLKELVMEAERCVV